MQAVTLSPSDIEAAHRVYTCPKCGSEDVDVKRHFDLVPGHRCDGMDRKCNRCPWWKYESAGKLWFEGRQPTPPAGQIADLLKFGVDVRDPPAELLEFLRRLDAQHKAE